VNVSYLILGIIALALILYLFWRKGFALREAGQYGHWLTRPGLTFSLMVMLYGIARFLLELLRDDNPYEWAGLTISQVMGLAMVITGIVLILVMSRMRPEEATRPTGRRSR